VTVVDSAKSAGLQYATDASPGITRTGTAPAFEYRTSRGRLVTSASTLKRIASLVLPPAWTDVWIAADARAHLQATGRDAAGRKQYRYHPTWVAERNSTKYHRMLAFARALPRIRRRAARDLVKPAHSRERVLATVVRLLERTHIRIGNEEYTRENGSYGLMTLQRRHVKIRGNQIRFEFRAKSGVYQNIEVDDARLAGAVRECQDLPGRRLFQYRDDRGDVRSLSAADVNAYLQEIAGDAFTAKDFRTWAGTLAAASALDEAGAAPSATAGARMIVRAIDRVAEKLGNTRAVCRKCYVHPAVLDAYRSGLTIGRMTARGSARGLRQDEANLVVLLRNSPLASAAA